MARSTFTAVNFITSARKPSGYSAGEIVEFNGWSASGDSGGAQWKATGNVIAASQSPVNLGDSRLSDADGNEFTLVQLTESAQPEINAAWLGVVGSGDIGDELQNVVNIAYARQVSVYQSGTITSSKKIIFEAPGDVNYWDDTSDLRPPTIRLDVIKYTGEDACLDLIGEVAGAKVKVNGLIGPGVTTIQTPGGGSERIGVRLSHNQNTIDIGSISDFNINILMDGAFNTVINVGSCFATIYGVHSRVGTVNGFNNQNNQITYGFIGGVFTSNSFPDDALRRSRGAKYGIYMQQGTAFKWTGGALKYVQRDSDSISIKLDSGAHNNDLFCYMEGARDDGYYIDCDGDDNNFFVSELRGTTAIKDAIKITGIGNHVSHIPGMTGIASFDARQPDPVAGDVSIDRGNRVTGKNEITNSVNASVLKHNLLHGVTPTTGGSGSLTTISDSPQESDGADSYKVTCNANTNVFSDFSGINISSETLDKLQIHTWVRGEVNHAKFAVYILDNADKTIVLNEPLTVGVTPASGWKKISSTTRIATPPSGSITVRVSAINTTDGETGCEVVYYPPVVTFNLDTTNRNLSNDALPNTDVVKGKVMPEEVYSMRAGSRMVNNVTDLAGNVLPTNGRASVVISGNTSGGNVSSIVNMRENTTVDIVNSSGASVTITSAAGEWTNNFALENGEAVRVIDVNGLKYLNRS